MKNENMNDRKQGTKAVWGGQSELFYQGSTEVPVLNTFITETKKSWPDVKFVSFGEFGEIWRNNENGIQET